VKSIGVDTLVACLVLALAVIVTGLLGIGIGNGSGGPYAFQNGLFAMVVGGVGAMIGGGIYLLPVWICSFRDSRFRIAILVLTLISVPADFALGFGLLLWIAALIWSICSPTGPVPPPVYVHVQQSPPSLPQPASIADELEKLSALRDAGHLTEEEFTRQRARLLS
jgi:hypothetical protein